MKANPGSVAPKRPGVYVCSTDGPSHWGYFMGYFNGQYWYEYTRGDHISNAKNMPRKKSARLAVTAWCEIDDKSFSEALKAEQKAPVSFEQRVSA